MTIQSKRLHILMLFLMIVTVMAAIFASDMYVASLPDIQASFNASVSQTQYTIAIYLLGLSLSQLIYGPLSDHIGRRKVLILGIIICLVGTAGCYFASSIENLIAMRFLQSLGSGACIVLTRSICRDCFSGEQLARYSSYLGIGISIAPAIAPALGGYVQQYWQWRSVFLIIFAIFFSLLIIISIALPETKAPAKTTLSLKQIAHNYWELLSSGYFLACCYIAAVSFSGLIVYYTLSPFIFHTQYQISPLTFGWLALLLMCANIVSRILNAILLPLLSSLQLLQMGLSLMSLAALFMLAASLTNVHSIVLIIAPMIIYMLGVGLVFGNVMAQAFTPFGHIAGSASALYSALQMIGAFIASVVASHIGSHQTLVLATLLSFFGCSGWLVFQNANHKRPTLAHQ